jgi:asparagine synthase (glutamine-hydrolysing)
MCGICGLVGSDDEAVLRAMTASMRHRGPDGEGVRCFPGQDARPPAGLGHRRLSIIDPTPRGAQPMSYADGRLWITYNGELYNFRALRDELERDGFRFRSRCDTEVLLAMYARDGAAMLARLNGIFAFAIWDQERGELFLARDRLGVKPLYYGEVDGRFAFASEIKALLWALPNRGLRCDVLPEYLTLLWVPDPDTLFEGIFKLPPGHCAVYAHGRLSVRRYWDMGFAPEEAAVGEWAERVHLAVRDAVRRQMVSDVPLGSFLSGGIDSSAIVSEMSALGSVATYTAGFRPDDLAHEIVPDDVRYARQVAHRFGVEHHEQVLEPTVVDLLPRLVWHMDEPVADPACITTFLICTAARESVKVMLSGMGGDEIFAGYPRHLAAGIARMADVLPSSVRAVARRGVVGHLTPGPPGRLRGPRRNVLKLAGGIDRSPVDRYLTYSSYYTRNELRRLLAADARCEADARDPLERHRDYVGRMASGHWLDQLLYLDLKTFLPCLNLAYTDKMSMAASTEVRVPLLDDDLVALAGRIPARLKLHRFTRKYVFKRSQAANLPPGVISRPKAGLGAPVRAWLGGELRPWVDDLLSARVIAQRGLFDPTEVRRLIDADAEGREDNALRVWALLTLELWQQTFVDASGREALTA